VTSTSPCTNVSLSGSISVSAAPTITLTSAAATSAQTVCNNTAIQNIVYTIGGSGNGASVTATLPAGVTGTFNAGVFTISGTPSVAGTYNYTVSTTSPCNNVSLSGSIVVTPLATITLTSAASTDAQTVCNLNAITNIQYTLGGSAIGATIAGTLPPGVSGAFNAGVFTISGTPSATGTFNYTVTSVSPCQNISASGSITVNPAPTITLTSAATTATQTVCQNAAATYIQYTIGGSGTGANVTGLPAGMAGVYNAGTFVISGTPSVSGVFNYTVTTVSPCANLSLSGTITVLALPTITLTSAASTANQTLCVNTAITPITYNLGGSATGASLTGSLPAGVTGAYNGGVYTISGTPTASGTFNFTINTVSVCTNVSLSGSIIVNALPVAGFTYSAIRCAGEVVTFTDASVPNATSITQWQWNYGDGPTQTIGTAGPVTHTYATANNYTVQLTVTNSNGCVSTVTSQQVTVNPKPLAAFSLTDVCIPTGLASFTDNSTISSGTINQWSWNFGDNTPTSSSQNPTHTYATGGAYNVTLTATSAAGCIKDTTRQLIATNAPTASFTVNNTGNVCSNTALSIKNTSVVNGFGNINRVDIYWDFNGNPTLITTDNTPTSGENYTHNYPVFGSPATITYKVLIKVYSGNGCEGQFYQDIVVYAAPKVQFGPVAAICQEVPSLTLTTANDLYNNPGVGTYSGNGISASPVFIPANAGPGAHPIQYLYVASNGCRDSATRIITVNPTPVLDLGPDRNILEGDQVALTPLTATGNGLTYLWTPGTYLNNATLAAPLCTPVNDITYNVVVTSSAGCKATDDLFVKVVKDFIIPNTFTPNGDGINDLWVIENLNLYPDHRVQVFNRYGQILYDTRNYNKPWDGTSNGKVLPSGTYYYIIDLGGARQTKKGYVTIVR